MKQKILGMLWANPKSNPKRSQNLTRMDPESTQDRPRADPRPPRSDLGSPWGGPKLKKIKKYIFEQKLVSKRNPFGADFQSFHGMKLRKQGLESVATTRAHVKKVAFLIGRY